MTYRFHFTHASRPWTCPWIESDGAEKVVGAQRSGDKVKEMSEGMIWESYRSHRTLTQCFDKSRMNKRRTVHEYGRPSPSDPNQTA
jgi:hypothetical protein